MRLAIEREMTYAMSFPFVDYGIDLELMAELEKGIRVEKIARSDIDTNPPKEVKEAIEKRIA